MDVVIVIVVCIALACLGGPLGVLILRARWRRFGRGEINGAIEVSAGWRHLQGG